MTWKPLEPSLFDENYERHLAILRAMGGDAAYRNNKYQVVVRYLDNGVMMLSIRRNDRAAIHDWRDFQRIKNELAGCEREAVEIYPAESRKVDTSNQYYLWVLPEGERVSWGFNERLISAKSVAGTRQRPFDDNPAERNEAAETDKNIEERFRAHVHAFGLPLPDEEQ